VNTWKVILATLVIFGAGIATGAFMLGTTGTASGAIASVSAVGGAVYDVTVNSLRLENTLGSSAVSLSASKSLYVTSGAIMSTGDGNAANSISGGQVVLGNNPAYGTEGFIVANKDLTIEIRGGSVAVLFEDWLRPEKVEANLSRLIEIRKLLPHYLFTKA